METVKQCEMFGCNSDDTQMHTMAPGTVIWICDSCYEESANEYVPASVDEAREIELANLEDIVNLNNEVVTPLGDALIAVHEGKKEALDDIAVKRLVAAASALSEPLYDCNGGMCLMCKQWSDENHLLSCEYIVLQDRIDDFYKYRNSL